MRIAVALAAVLLPRASTADITGFVYCFALNGSTNEPQLIAADLDSGAGDMLVTANSTTTVRSTVVAASAAVAAGQTAVGASIGMAIAENDIGFAQSTQQSINPTYVAGTSTPARTRCGPHG